MALLQVAGSKPQIPTKSNTFMLQIGLRRATLLGNYPEATRLRAELTAIGAPLEVPRSLSISERRDALEKVLR